VAAEDLAGPQGLAALEKVAEQAVPRLADEPAWPTLQARLLLLAAAGIDPVAQLLSVIDARELDTAIDRAAVLGWRLDDIGDRNAAAGPLPWLPSIPQHLQAHEMWGSYLAGRAATVEELAERVRTSENTHQRPGWAGLGGSQPPSAVVEDVEVWRAAMGVSPDDHRPTGPVQQQKAARIWQRHLDQAVGQSLAPEWREWGPLVAQLAPAAADDSFAPVLAKRLAALSHAGIDATPLLRTTADGKPLPDDHAAAALWWRICRHHSPSLSAQIDHEPPTAAGAKPTLSYGNSAVAAPTESTIPDRTVADRYLEPDLAVAAMLRDLAGPPEQTDADVTHMFARAMAWRECPISRERMVEVNQLSLAYFRHRFPSSWGQHYLADRFGADITDDPRFQPGQAPEGWTNLVDHLRRHRVSDEELLITGIATIASTGRLIDRFRDRIIFPIIHNGEVLGFVGRRRPDPADTGRAGPKYLNTADTPLFHKGAQLFGAIDDQLSVDAIPVIVEGPMDAIAVTVGSQGRYIGVAPLGASLTEEQARQLACIGAQPIVATDADPAGRIAAERDFWMLSCYRLDPLYARLPDGTDPADLLALGGPTALTEALTAAQPLVERLVDERLANLPPAEALLEATRVVAARPSRHWDQDCSAIGARLGVPVAQVRQGLLTLVKQWNTDPRRAAQQPLQAIGEAKRRISAVIEGPAGQPGTAPTRGLDHRLQPNPQSAGSTRGTKLEGRRVPPSSRTGTPRTPAR
jgi:DNA primase catalytic core